MPTCPSTHLAVLRMRFAAVRIWQDRELTTVIQNGGFAAIARAVPRRSMIPNATWSTARQSSSANALARHEITGLMQTPRVSESRLRSRRFELSPQATRGQSRHRRNPGGDATARGVNRSMLYGKACILLQSPQKRHKNTAFYLGVSGGNVT